MLGRERGISRRRLLRTFEKMSERHHHLDDA
jgi:hypothetical protein